MNTKISKILTVILSLTFCGAVLEAGEGHGHTHDSHSHADSKKKAGPNGGRVINKGGVTCEFLLTDDRFIEIRFLDEDGAIVKPSGQVITVVGGDRSAPTELVFEDKGDAMVSSASFPEGKALPLVLEIRQTKDSDPVRERIRLATHSCGSCDYLEYACVCGH
ncbi:hypothetical protein MLD52_06305 [Puniceicoccaceae bacterium K14]|nr:hypothetical protein [Puniceicoccaceae bacterium K14]